MTMHFAKKARLIAFYLPQFHPIPENDEWWGRGFTEWTNVAKAKPLFRNHAQPVVPSDLGFYDLRVPEVREAQASLAKSCGLEGFCYWHYWFGEGRRILERPFEEVVRSGKPDLPFCLAWANQSWTGIWHGSPKKVLIEQKYPGREDDEAHFASLLPAFRDDRYIRVDGRPLFVLFDPFDIPDPRRWIANWQECAVRNDLPKLYFVAMTNKYPDSRLDAFDAVTSLPPQDFIGDRSRYERALTRLQTRDLYGLVSPRFKKPAVFDYASVVEHAFRRTPDASVHIPCVLPNWDNTPRSGSRGVVFNNSTPELFRRYLDKAFTHVEGRAPDHKIIFVKAWNEWAEGNYVEPDLAHGHAYLDTIGAFLSDRAVGIPQADELAAAV